MTGDELRATRLSKGLSRRQLAALTGLHPDSVKYWERKAQIDLRGHAPKLMLEALDVEAPETPRRSARLSFKWGNNRTVARARNRVLSEIDIRIDFDAGIIPSKHPATCGAITRKDRPCRAKPLPGKRRCKFHGGRSTGPKTPEGKARIADAQRRRWTAWRAANGAGGR